ncbi:MAG: hypothetical protein HYY76_17590 [Acidobacteria bacterium]|nr:hypothetical protein [Acidobacteriota bacterium]
MRVALVAFVTAAWLRLSPVAAIAPAPFEGAVHGFPVLRDLGGRRLANGEFSQWNADGRLHVVITYVFGRGRRIEERVVMRQRPLFVKVPDATIRLTTPPAGFLRWEGALAQPNDPMIRVDLLP